MTNLNNSDELIDNLWGRALDMTSEDFADDDTYLKAQTNYRNYTKKELDTYIAQDRQRLLDEIEGKLPEKKKIAGDYTGNSYYNQALSEVKTILKGLRER